MLNVRCKGTASFPTRRISFFVNRGVNQRTFQRLRRNTSSLRLPSSLVKRLLLKMPKYGQNGGLPRRGEGSPRPDKQRPQPDQRHDDEENRISLFCFCFRAPTRIKLRQVLRLLMSTLVASGDISSVRPRHLSLLDQGR